jgi:katanin p60 ATPase-containing subunit A1
MPGMLPEQPNNDFPISLLLKNIRQLAGRVWIMSSLMALKASTDANTAEQKRAIEKKRNIMILIHQHLIESGYIDAAEHLQRDMGQALLRFEVADNMDMGLIISDYESYYEMRFDKKPKLVRKLKEGEESSFRKAAAKGSRTSNRGRQESGSKSGKLPVGSGASAASTMSSNVGGNGDTSGPEVDDVVFGIQGTSVTTQNSNNTAGDIDHLENRLLKPPPHFVDKEMRELAATISREIYQESPNVRFSDIIELDEAKRLLSEAVQLPLRFPQIFTGILRPWKGILLHGPPGTGKTMLARAVATECRTTFFNISASTLVSKWRGDSEKLVRALFEVARYHAPSTIFLDEIDSILGARGGDGNEHEASRRMKTELLVQMDGLASKKNSASSSSSSGSSSRGGGGSGKDNNNTSEQVFLMAASNLPWDLDVAVLRRLEKRVLVPLPALAAREAMLRAHLQGRASPELDFAHVAALTEGYSGADLELLSREAAMKPVRRLMDKISTLSTPSAVGAGMPAPPQRGSGGLDAESMLSSDPVAAADMLGALESTKPSSDGNYERYAQWQAGFGSV